MIQTKFGGGDQRPDDLDHGESAIVRRFARYSTADLRSSSVGSRERTVRYASRSAGVVLDGDQLRSVRLPSAGSIQESTDRLAVGDEQGLRQRCRELAFRLAGLTAEQA